MKLKTGSHLSRLYSKLDFIPGVFPASGAVFLAPGIQNHCNIPKPPFCCPFELFFQYSSQYSSDFSFTPSF
jgi:hypothetical protein